MTPAPHGPTRAAERSRCWYTVETTKGTIVLFRHCNKDNAYLVGGKLTEWERPEGVTRLSSITFSGIHFSVLSPLA